MSEVTVEQALAKLKQKTPDGVAAFLRRQGIKGSKATSGQTCPVAAFVRREANLTVSSSSDETWPDAPWFWVYSTCVEWGERPKYNTVDHPEPVKQFIEAYDNGRYKFLRGED